MRLWTLSERTIDYNPKPVHIKLILPRIHEGFSFTYNLFTTSIIDKFVP